MKYILGATFYCDERELFYTHIGTADMELWLSVWAETEERSIGRANYILELLIKN